MLDSQYIRYDATRNRKISVRYQDFFDETAMQDVVYFGLRIYTRNDSVAEIFGVETEKDDAVVRAAHLEALRRGDHVFFMEFGRHSGDWFRLHQTRPTRSWDSACCGICIVPHDKWLNAMPRKTYAKTFVFKTLCDAFNERVTGILNGWVYEAIVTFEDGDSFSMANFLSPEEALECAMSEYPDIKYSEWDFECEQVYRLATKTTSLAA